MFYKDEPALSKCIGASHVVTTRQVMRGRLRWAHLKPVDAIAVLRDLQRLLEVVISTFYNREPPPSFRDAINLTGDCILKLETIPEVMNVDLFSMTVVFFERALARYHTACASQEPELDRLLQASPQELKFFFTGSADAGDVDEDQPETDPLSIITTFMARKYKRTDGEAQKYGQRPFFVVKLARNIEFHGNETPREVALLISASIESALLLQELYPKNVELSVRDRQQFFNEHIKPTLVECRILLSWLTSAPPNTMRMEPLLEAAVDLSSFPGQHDNDALFPNAFEKLRRFILNQEPFECSHPRLFSSELDLTDLVRAFSRFPHSSYRSTELRQAIQTKLEVPVDDATDAALDAMLKTWLLETAIPQDQIEGCRELSAAQLLVRQLAWLPDPVFKTVSNRIVTYRFGFPYLNPTDKRNLRKVFASRFHHYPAGLSPQQAVKERGLGAEESQVVALKDFEFTFPIHNIPTSVEDTRWDFISMLLMMGAESSQLGNSLANESVVPSEFDGGAGGGWASSAGLRGLSGDTFDDTAKPPKTASVPLWSRQSNSWSNVYVAVIKRDPADVTSQVALSSIDQDYRVLQHYAELLRRGAITQRMHDDVVQQRLLTIGAVSTGGAALLPFPSFAHALAPVRAPDPVPANTQPLDHTNAHVARAIAILEQLFDAAGLLPHTQYGAFARALITHGVGDEESIVAMLEEDDRFLKDKIGLNSAQNLRLVRYLRRGQ
jgi:hypothetical protein